MTPEIIRLAVLAVIVGCVIVIFIARQVIINKNKIKISERAVK